jgi:hypothetical protein
VDRLAGCPSSNFIYSRQLDSTVADPLIVCTHAQTPDAILAPKVIGLDDLKRCEELGTALATGMSIGVF